MLRLERLSSKEVASQIAPVGTVMLRGHLAWGVAQQALPFDQLSMSCMIGA